MRAANILVELANRNAEWDYTSLSRLFHRIDLFDENVLDQEGICGIKTIWVNKTGKGYH